MRHPITCLIDNLAWTTSGVVWATWRIQPVPYGRRTINDKRVVKDLHRVLIRALDGESLMLGLSVSTDPVTIVERQIKGVDLELCPGWAEEAEANLDRLAEMALGERVYYLAVPLSNTGSRKWLEPARASINAVKDTMSLPRARVSDTEIAVRRIQMEHIQHGIPAVFDARAVTVGEQVWIAAHHQARGLTHSTATPEEAVELGHTPTLSGAALPEPLLDPGALTDLEGSWRSRARINPMTRRVLKVTNPTVPDQPASYQAPMVMSSTPQGGVVFPGSELLARLDEYGPEMDWAIRLRINARDKVMRANRKAVREIQDQYEQRDDEGGSFGSHDLDHASGLLTEYQALFANDRLEVEVEHTIIVIVAGSDMDTTLEHAEQITRILGSSDFKFERPVGAEEDLWWAMHVGVPTTSTVRAYSQFTSSDMFARLVPFTSTALGGHQGPIFALNQSTARVGVVHLDPGGYPELDKSGSMAFVAELGAGKTVGMKTINAHIVSMGGQMFAIDKSSEGEWAWFAAALSPDAIVVDPTDLQYSMDPLRIFDSMDDAGAVAQAFFATLLDVAPRETDGITLGRILQESYLREHAIQGSYDLMVHLETADLPGAQTLAQQMCNYAGTELGALIFDQSLPPVRGDADAIVWRTHRMEQPTTEELAQSHLFRGLTPQKVFGRAYYRLLTACGRRWAFADRSRPAVFNCDEAYDLFANIDNARDLEHFVRQGRRPKALALFGSHDPDNDFGTETMRRLIPTRVVLRQTDKDLARSSIRFLGIDEVDPEFDAMVKQLTTDTSPADPDTGVPVDRRGECFIRDAFGAIGEARILIPSRPDLARAVLSTPPKAAVRA